MTNYLNKEIIEHKDTITDKKLLVKYLGAFLLGDGNLRKVSTEKGNSAYQINQISDHDDYILWQAEILRTLTRLTIYHYPARTDKYGKHNAVTSLISLTHPFYTTIYRRTYIAGKKQVSPHELKLLDWEMAAIHIMDDGCLSKSRVSVDIATNGFTYGDVRLLQAAYKEKLDIPFSIGHHNTKDSTQYVLRVHGDRAKRLLDGISKYVLPSFRYKLDYERVGSLSNE